MEWIETKQNGIKHWFHYVDILLWNGNKVIDQFFENYTEPIDQSWNWWTSQV